MGIERLVQSMGAASCVVGLSRWFTDKNRGTFYGFWSASHNIGEAMTFIFVASIVSAFGWQYGFIGAAVVGIAGISPINTFFHDTPASKGVTLPGVKVEKKKQDAAYNKAQSAVLKNPLIWILALSSALCISVDMQ